MGGPGAGLWGSQMGLSWRTQPEAPSPTAAPSLTALGLGGPGGLSVPRFGAPAGLDRALRGDLGPQQPPLPGSPVGCQMPTLPSPP